MAVTINLLVLLFAAVAAAQTSCPPRGMYVVLCFGPVTIYHTCMNCERNQICNKTKMEMLQLQIPSSNAISYLWTAGLHYAMWITN